jgi:hypothetical protein
VNCHDPHANTDAEPVADPDDGLALPLYNVSNVYTEDGHNLAYDAGGNLDPINPEGSGGGNQEIDYIQFCLTCHDGTTPPGVVMSANMINMADAYGSDQHGNSEGSSGSRTGKGNLKQPWTTAADFAAGNDPSNPYAAINCNTCHGPHGTGNIFNLRNSINVAGTQMTIGGPAGSQFNGFSGTTYTLPEVAGNQTDHRWGAWCTFCHNMSAHAGVTEETDCQGGHMHGGSNF